MPRKLKVDKIKDILDSINLVAAMGELGLFEKYPNQALFVKMLLEKKDLKQAERLKEAYDVFAAREKLKKEEKELKHKKAKDKLESLGLSLDDLRELL